MPPPPGLAILIFNTRLNADSGALRFNLGHKCFSAQSPSDCAGLHTLLEIRYFIPNGASRILIHVLDC